MWALWGLRSESTCRSRPLDLGSQASRALEARCRVCSPWEGCVAWGGSSLMSTCSPGPLTLGSELRGWGWEMPEKGRKAGTMWLSAGVYSQHLVPGQLGRNSSHGAQPSPSPDGESRGFCPGSCCAAQRTGQDTGKAMRGQFRGNREETHSTERL